MAICPRLHVVTGKGGVGKSTVSCAIALASAARGARTLAIEIPDRAGLCRILDVEPSGPGVETPAGDRLTVSYFDGAAALTEYLTRVVRLGRLRRVVLEHPLYRAFIHAAPGVQELMAIGKVRDELRRRDGRHPHWDVIVLDAGASGHSLQLLRMAAAAARAFSSGRVHREATRIDALLRDPAVCAVHVVATAEEMPLREAEHVVATLRQELGMPLGSVFVNQCRQAVPANIDRALETLERMAVGPALRTAQKDVVAVAFGARAWAEREERGIADLERRCGLPVVRLPRLAGGAVGRTIAEALAPRVAEVVL